MTREEAVALLERYSNYDGMGIPNLAGCKEAMKVAAEALKEVYPELAESEDERIRKELVEAFEALDIDSSWNGIPVKSILAWLEEQKDIEDRWIEDRGQCFWDGVEEGKMLAEKQEEQKPAEWSEEDVKRLYSIGTQIGFLKGKYSEYQKDIDWLYTLAEKMGFHKCKTGEVVTEWKKEDIDDKMLSKPKQEWSKEDEMYLSQAIETLEHENYLILAEKLKSLKPSWKPSEDELGKRHLDGYCMGREDTLREMKDFVESHFTHREYKSPECGTCASAWNTSSGTSTATLHGNTSATDGKEHNPSFTD